MNLLNTNEMLKSSEADNRRMALEELFNDEVNEINLLPVVYMISDPDAGVRDYVAMLLSQFGMVEVSKKLVTYISSEDLAVRNLAGEVLRNIGQHAVQPMIEFLNHSGDEEKKFLIDLLGLMSAKEASKPIIKIYKSSKNSNVVLACIEALGNLKCTDAEELLIENFHKNELYKPTLIESLGKIGSENTRELLFKAYSHEDELTRYAIIESLGEIGHEAEFYFLSRELTLQNGPITWVIISSLSQIKSRIGYELTHTKTTRRRLLNTIRNADMVFKHAAINMLPEQLDSEVIHACLSVLGSDPWLDETIKEKIIHYPDAIVEVFPDLLETKPVNTKELFLFLLDMISVETNFTTVEHTDYSSKKFIDTLVNYLEFPDEEVRKAVIELLFSLEKESALMFADVILEDECIWNRMRMLEILENFNNPEALKIVRKLSLDNEEMICDRARAILNDNQKLQYQ